MVPAPFDDELRRAVDSVADRLRSEITQRLTAELTPAVEAARSAALAEGTAAAERAEQAAHQAEQAAHQAEQALAARERELEQARSAEEAARRDLEQLQSQLDAARTELTNLKSELDAAAQARDAAQARATALADADAQLQDEYDALRSSHDALRSSHDALDRAVKQLQSSEAELQQRVADLQDAERQLVETHAAALANATAAASAHAVDAGLSERLVDAVRAIDRARSLSETLDTLVSCAAREAARAAVILTDRDGLRCWRAIGFSPSGEVEAGTAIAASDAGIVGDAVRRRMPIEAGAAPAFASQDGGAAMIAVPIAIGGEIVAVLYADAHGEAASDSAAQTWISGVEVLARHAARALESLLAFRAAQVVTGWTSRAGAAASAIDAAHGMPAAFASGQDGAARHSGAGGDADREQHEAAQRYARLLVSEIKLYHQADVVEGRRQRDLMSRLGGEIAHARVLYEERVAPSIRSGADYFGAELIRTLADGDPSLVAARSSASWAER